MFPPMKFRTINYGMTIPLHYNAMRMSCSVCKYKNSCLPSLRDDVEVAWVKPGRGRETLPQQVHGVADIELA